MYSTVFTILGQTEGANGWLTEGRAMISGLNEHVRLWNIPAGTSGSVCVVYDHVTKSPRKAKAGEREIEYQNYFIAAIACESVSLKDMMKGGKVDGGHDFRDMAVVREPKSAQSPASEEGEQLPPPSLETGL